MFRHGMGQLWNAHVAVNAFGGSRQEPITGRIHKWMLDSGAPYHIINQGCVVDLEKRNIALLHPLRVGTANGHMVLETQVDTYVPALGATVRCYVAPKNAPACCPLVN